MRSIEEIKTEIKTEFGFVPVLFDAAQVTPAVYENLWQQMLVAYTKNPLPELFKEKLIAYLSRFCQSSYCIVIHCCALRPLGMSGPEVLDLVTTPVPTTYEIANHIKTLKSEYLNSNSWPEAATLLDSAVFNCAVLIYLKPQLAQDCFEVMRSVLEPFHYNHLISFISFVKMYHAWVEAQPELPYHQDERVKLHLPPLLEEAPQLQGFFENYFEKIKEELQSVEIKRVEENAKQQIEAIQQEASKEIALHNTQLHQMTRASIAINPSLPFDTLLEVITKQARKVVGANLAYVYVKGTANYSGPAAKISSTIETKNIIQSSVFRKLLEFVSTSKKSIFLSEVELDVVLHRLGVDTSRFEQKSIRELLCVPLLGRNDESLGLLLLLNKIEGTFDEDDEVLLIQLAQMSVAAIINARLYEETRQAVETQKELDRLRDQFLSIASHELRTPLTSIKGFTQILQRNLLRVMNFDVAQESKGQDVPTRVPLLSIERQARILNNISYQVNRLIALIEEMLDISHIQSGELRLKYAEKVDIVELVRRIVIQQQDISLSRSVELILTRQSIICRLDETRIEQVVSNLISNAIKYSQPEAPIKVGVNYELPYATENRATAGAVRVWVSDMGFGISPEQQAHIFEQYYRIRRPDDQNTEGLGLGLYISREIIKRHGGQLWVESEPGKGSVFSFTLPLE